MEMFTKLQFSVSFHEALVKVPKYAKFMKKLLTRKRKLRFDEHIALTEECNAIIQRKLPPKLKDLGRFNIPCAKGSLKINHTLCDFGASINLMPLSLMRKLNLRERKPT